MNRQRRLIALMVALVASLAGVSSVTQPVAAGSGFTTWDWGDDYVRVSVNSNSYSNGSAFWQSILSSVDCSITVDGYFGNQTRSRTESFQALPFMSVQGTTVDGIVGAETWANAHAADSVYGQRLSYTGYTDGYTVSYYTYYGGTDSFGGGKLGWSSYGEQWFFNAANSGGGTNWALTAATYNRTIGNTGNRCAP